jgi:hypothetical protein
LVTVFKRSGVIDLTTKGDANPSVDNDILVIGSQSKLPRMVGHLKYFGRVLIFLTSKSSGLVGTIALTLAMVFALIEFALSGRHRNKREQELNEREAALNEREAQLNKK